MYKYSKDGISVLSVLDARRAKKWLVPREDTSHTQPQAEILFHGAGAVKGGLGEPCGKQEPQAHGGTLEHREQLLNHQGAGGGTRRTWRFRV